jgi:hypothetical protein
MSGNGSHDTAETYVTPQAMRAHVASEVTPLSAELRALGERLTTNFAGTNEAIGEMHRMLSEIIATLRRIEAPQAIAAQRRPRRKPHG